MTDPSAANSTLKARITGAMKDAMRARDKPRLGAIRLILADIKRIEVDERIDVSDERVLVILDKMTKQRKDSETQFTAAGRDELAAIERAEMEVIAEFLPAALAESEIDALITAAVADTGAESMKDMGKVMGILKPQLQGRADMAAVSQRIKAQLG
ncbi:MAG: GatB/YqeY domain-containing protein [Porticoccaceae bacterium]